MFINNCSCLLNVNWASISYINVSTISDLRNFKNVSTINVSLITNWSRINSALNQNLDIIASQSNLSQNTSVCFVLHPNRMFNGDNLKYAK